MTRLPQITALFWVMKIAATTLGETGGDLLAQTLNIGYTISSLLFIGLFLVSLVAQLKATKFHPALCWTVIVSTSTAGTTMSDFINRSGRLLQQTPRQGRPGSGHRGLIGGADGDSLDVDRIHARATAQARATASCSYCAGRTWRISRTTSSSNR